MHRLILFVLLGAMMILAPGCGCHTQAVQSISGTQMATVDEVKKDADGLTVEQRNIKRRIEMDNQPGAIKHLYIISAYSGQVLIYSTVDGKVTSSGKRLTPNRITGVGYNSITSGEHYPPQVTVGSTSYNVDELLGEDGTVGNSAEYLYWWDAQGVYHQQYVTGGMILHISDQPIAVKGIVINMEVASTPREEEE